MRNVIVTGASRGLGLAIATRLVQSGYHVLALARHQTEALARLGEQANATRSGAIAFRACDLSDLDGIGSLLQALLEEFGPPYGLVNNAGIGTGGALSGMALQDMHYQMRLNALAPVVLSQHALVSMQAAGSGRIVNISSIAALTGYSGLSVYSATKAALLGFTRSLAREAGPFGITVNAIAPGFIATDMTKEMDPQGLDKIRHRSALRRLPEADDVSHGVEYLLGEGGRNITGSIITIDAGNTA